MYLDFYRLWAPHPALKTRYTSVYLESNCSYLCLLHLPLPSVIYSQARCIWDELAIFVVRFQDAIEAKGFWGHFTGAKPCPTAVIPGTKAVTVPTAVPAEGEEAPAPVAAAPTTPVLTAEELAVAQKQWDKDELSAKSLLTQKIPDSTLMRIHAKKTVHERWEAIISEYTEKGAYAQTDLRKEFLKSKCPV